MFKKSMLLVIVAIICISSAGIAVADFRAELAAMDSLDGVWTIDPYHTVIWSRKPMDDEPKFANEFLSICDRYGGIMVKVQERDALTRRVTEKWAPVKIEYRKNWMGDGAHKYANPTTGKDDFFPSVFSNIAYRVRGEFTTINKFTSRVYKDTHVHGFLLEHDTPQGFSYKIEKVGAADLNSIPPEGDLYRIDPVSRINGGNLFQYLLALSKNLGGRYSWVVADENGRLAETNSYNAYAYIIDAMVQKPFPKQWFFILDGKQPFTVKRTVGPKVDELLMFHRLAEGLQYAPVAGSGQLSTGSIPKPAIGQATGLEAKLANAAAMIRDNTTMRENPMELYDVLYHGDQADGAHVTVQKFYTPEGGHEKQLLTSNDYRVISGKVFAIENDMIANSIVPNEVERLIPGVAKHTQAKGSATAIYQDYMVIGQALRDKDKCKVEVKIFKNHSFVTALEVNGCNS